ncbi:EM14S01-3B_G0023380.mRNA.1.CDS.1 [Saccharomyces cerevisiae]|nr:EM14S01-3B_G0023380.mRNA.1.CDS.1 [Saccharomyces cerevisiae]
MFHYPITLSIFAFQLLLTSMTASHNLYHHLTPSMIILLFFSSIVYYIINPVFHLPWNLVTAPHRFMSSCYYMVRFQM